MRGFVIWFGAIGDRILRGKTVERSTRDMESCFPAPATGKPVRKPIAKPWGEIIPIHSKPARLSSARFLVKESLDWKYIISPIGGQRR